MTDEFRRGFACIRTVDDDGLSTNGRDVLPTVTVLTDGDIRYGHLTPNQDLGRKDAIREEVHMKADGNFVTEGMKGDTAPENHEEQTETRDEIDRHGKHTRPLLIRTVATDHRGGNSKDFTISHSRSK
jgi:hypothetical protein